MTTSAAPMLFDGDGILLEGRALLDTLLRLEQWHAREAVRHQEESAFYGDLVKKLAWPKGAPVVPVAEIAS